MPVASDHTDSVNYSHGTLFSTGPTEGLSLWWPSKSSSAWEFRGRESGLNQNDMTDT